MIYKPVLFGYVAAVMIVVASLVLVLIMFRQDKKYERNKLTAIIGMQIASLIMNTLYFLSFFDSLTTLTTVYLAVERFLDIACSYLVNVFLLLFLHNIARESNDNTRARLYKRMFRPVFITMTAAFLYAAIVYVTVVSDDYHVTKANMTIAESGQIILTLAICVITGFYVLGAMRSIKLDVSGNRPLCVLIIIAGVTNIVTALYNGAQSLRMFHGYSELLDWSGMKDCNTWLFIISDLVSLLIILHFYRMQVDGMTAAALSEVSPNEQLIIPENLGLTQREHEIVKLVLNRSTYEEIAEELYISKYTVKRHIHNIYEKAGVSRRDELIKQIRESNLRKGSEK